MGTKEITNILWGGAAAALLGATLAEWQKKRDEEEAARRASMQNSGGEEEDDRPRKKTPGQIAYEKKQQQKRIVAESQALMNQKKATQQVSAKAMQDHRAGEKNAVAIAAAYESQKAIQSHREGERKEVGTMVLTLVIVLFTSTLLSTSLGGIASMLANAQVSVRLGQVAGLISAITASFGARPEPVEGVGYLVRVGVGRLAG